MKRIFTGLTLLLALLVMFSACKEITQILGLNNAPVANAGEDQTVDFGDEVTLDGSASSDEDGDELSYQWTLTAYASGSALRDDDISAATKQLAYVTPDEPGVYIFTLTVTDEYGDSSSDDVKVTVNEQLAPNTPSGLAVSGATETTLNVSWNAAAGADNYTVFRDFSQTGAFSTLAYYGTSTSFTDTGLFSEATYWYKVMASNNAGDSALSSAVSGTTLAAATEPPATPENLEATTVTGSLVALEWDISSGATSYKLERSLVDVDASFVQIYNDAGTSYTDTTVDSGTIYYYRVSASNSFGPSAVSTPSLEVTTALSAPTGLAVNGATQTSLEISWVGVTGADAYTLARSGDGGTTYTDIDIAAVSPYTDDTPPLASGTVYYYKVKATNTGGAESDYTAPKSGLTKPATPEAPSFTTVTESTLTVTWVAVTGAEEYTVYSDKSVDGTFTDLEYNGTALEFTDTGLAAATPYDYQVVAWNTSGYSGYSDTSTMVTAAAAADPPGVPGTPTVLAVTSESVTIIWTAAVDAAIYKVYSNSTGVDALAGTTSALQFTEDGLDPETTYSFYVVANNSQGDGPASASVDGTTQIGGPATPSAPTVANNTLTPTTALDISWTAVTGADTYTLWRATDGVTFTDLGLTETGTSYTDTGLNPGTTYFYKVQATNAGGVSDLSVFGFAATTSDVTIPSGVEVITPTVDSLTVSWDDTGADSYLVFRDISEFGSFANQLGSVTGTEFVDSGLPAVTTFYYKVKAMEGLAVSAFSLAASGTTLAPPLTAPTGLEVSGATATSLNISWDMVEGADEYTLAQKETELTNWQIIYSGPNRFFTDAGLAPMTSYDYRVLAQNLDDISPYSGTVSGMTGGATLEPPAGVTATAIDNTSIEVTWDAVTGADFYKIYRQRWDSSFNFLMDVDGVDTSFTNNNLPSGTEFSYKIKSVNENGDSADSDVATAKTLGPQQPDYIDAYDANAYSVQVSWNWMEEAEGYILYRTTDPDGVWDPLPPIFDSWTRDGGLTPNTEYFYKVTAFAGGEESSFSPIVSIWTADPPDWLPSDPWLWDAGITSTSVKLEWDFIYEAAYYRVYMSDTGELGSYYWLADTPDTKFDVLMLDPETPYWFDVTAVNDYGETDLEVNTMERWTNPIPAGPPATPMMWEPNVGDVWIDLNWDWVDNAEYFILERSYEGGGFEQIYMGPDTWFYQDGLVPGIYQYQVAAGNTTYGNSAFSDPLTVEVTGTGGVIIIVE
jgi:fibronectin type 3 domain-containing protein